MSPLVVASVSSSFTLIMTFNLLKESFPQREEVLCVCNATGSCTHMLPGCGRAGSAGCTCAVGERTNTLARANRDLKEKINLPPKKEN